MCGGCGGWGGGGVVCVCVCVAGWRGVGGGRGVRNEGRGWKDCPRPGREKD